MAITTLDGLIGGARQIVPWIKTGALTTVAANFFTPFAVAGQPGAGTLAGTSTAAGVVPDSSTAGCPTLASFGGGATGYIDRVDFGSTVACRIRILDMLFKAGAYSFNSAVTLASQPSYSARIPGTDYRGTQIWLEQVTASTGTQSIAVTYTNQDGTAARTTGTISVGAAFIVGRMIQLPLQAGDSGVQKIESVTGTVATVGTFNILVLRPLWTGRVPLANAGDTYGPDRTGMPVVFATSALYPIVAADSTALGVPEMAISVVNG